MFSVLGDLLSPTRVFGINKSADHKSWDGSLYGDDFYPCLNDAISTSEAELSRLARLSRNVTTVTKVIIVAFK